MERKLLNGKISARDIRSLLSENNFLKSCKMVIVSECYRKDNDLIKHNSVIAFPENPKLCKRIDDNRN